MSTYTLMDYLNTASYEVIADMVDSYENVCSIIGPLLLTTIVTVDGPTNSGKSSLSSGLITYSEQQSRPISLLPLDYFLTNRSIRSEIMSSIEAGQTSIAEYSRLAWNHNLYDHYISLAKSIISEADHAENIEFTNTYNRQTGAQDKTNYITVYPDGNLLLEGVGVHYYHNQSMSTAIRVDVADDLILYDRVLQRESKKARGAKLSTDYLRWRFEIVDLPHASYLRQISHANADFVVDTSTNDRMVVYKKL